MNRFGSFAMLIVVAATSACDKPTPVRAPEKIDYSLVRRDELAKLPDGTNIVFPIAKGNHLSGRTYGLMDENGTVLIRPSFNYVSQTSAGRLPRPYGYWCGQEGALLRSPKVWLYVGKYGSRAMKPQDYGDYLLNLGDSLFVIGDQVLNNRSPTDAHGFIPSGVFDPSGQWNPPEGILPRGWLSEGLVPITDANGLAGYADRKGNVVIDPQFAYAAPFYDGLAAVGVGERYGYIDRTGEVVIQPQFTHVSWFENGLAIVSDGGEETIPWVIDRKGNQINALRSGRVPRSKHNLRGFENGLLLSDVTETNPVTGELEGWYGFLCPDDTWAIEPTLTRAVGFTDKVTIVTGPVSMGGEDHQVPHLCDQNGNLVARVQTASWNVFKFGLAGDEQGEDGYVDTQGNTIWKPDR